MSIVSFQVLPRGYSEYKDTVLLPTEVSTQSCMTEKENSERALKVIRHSPLVVKSQDLKERVLRAGYSVCDAEAGSTGSVRSAMAPPWPSGD